MNTCNLTLSCGIQDQSVTYTWYWESGSFSKQLQSSVLEDVHTPQSYSKSYTCQVSNPISRQNSTIHFTSPCVQGKSLCQGSWGGHRVTSFLLNEEKCGDLFPLLVIEFGGESQRHQWGVVDLDSPCVSDIVTQQASSPLWSSVSSPAKGSHVPFACPALISAWSWNLRAGSLQDKLRFQDE